MEKRNDPARVTVDLELPEKLYQKLAEKSLQTGRTVEDVVVSAIRQDMDCSFERKETLCSKDSSYSF